MATPAPAARSGRVYQIRVLCRMGRLTGSLFALSLAPAVSAHTGHTYDEEIVVSGRSVDLVGSATSASEGVVGQAELALRPLYRAGEILESVPGLVATQHSGTGKANQYFLRGFNLDHGTDFATSYGVMPVNMRSHGHGQGYTDLNFVIPELVQRIDYRKGPYYAATGDFSSAGSATITPFARLAQGRIDLSTGNDGYRRLLAMDSTAAAGGDLLYALEGARYDGPWRDIDTDPGRINATLRWTAEIGPGVLSLMGMAYDATWNSADQIPSRAVEQGLIGTLGSLDRSVGGASERYSLSAEWDAGDWEAALYSIDYALELWSNFTYFLDDPARGDQFEQVDRRRIHGAEFSRGMESQIAGLAVQNTAGLQWRRDDIPEVGLHRSRNRGRLGTIRSDAVTEDSLGLFINNEIRWNARLRSTLGLRLDAFRFEVADRAGVNINGIDLAANSGRESDAVSSLRASVVYTPGKHWELYAAAGQAFHSNDARGTTARIDPASGESVRPVDPLVRSHGAETGIRAFLDDRLNASLSVWWLSLDSELLFVGDAGNTEASRASERSGLELTGYWQVSQDWSADIEYAWTHAQFTERDPTDPALGDAVPGSIGSVLSLGLSTRGDSGAFGSLRLRYFGPRDLDENGTVRSDNSLALNLRAGLERGDLSVTVDVLNLLDSDDHDITYWYESRLRGEAQPVPDLHYHVMEPRSVRVSAGYRF